MEITLIILYTFFTIIEVSLHSPPSFTYGIITKLEGSTKGSYIFLCDLDYGYPDNV